MSYSGKGIPHCVFWERLITGNAFILCTQLVNSTCLAL